MENKLPTRKQNRLENHDYSSAGTYFLTICTKRRQNYFWTAEAAEIQPSKKINKTPFEEEITENPQEVCLSPMGKIVEEAIQRICVQYPSLFIEGYVIMPDHIHLILTVCADEFGQPLPAPTMARVVNQLKGYITKHIGASIWQKSFFDHVIRNTQDYEVHMTYIYENPMRWQWSQWEQDTKI